ncbi:putative metal-dependent enzyme (double-stranded beta helix superfamily) [Luteimonas cucumeris]|uniref:Putative metal-dependent enzyme (Double-stranded beta helix superfamily) n=1 Tax=Luteimonas cucumeris TaxID=985012 RepID=A0A562KX63_9GAMM|nr:cysteine dioxygenase family protein [Luteimonas cucumeris]TWI00002.1 putative metal-dependent enzyme (double-stranded beta helix superfamily) [Luteimonas cucumeris]
MAHNVTAERRESFALLEDVIVLADIAMASSRPERIVPMLVEGLSGAIANVGPLPAWLLATDSRGYVRRELYRSPEHDYQVLAITWAPGQGSAVHDHADTWGVEAVLQGELEVVDYRIAGRRGALTALRPTDHRPLPAGSLIGLLPPHDLHACRNASARVTAVSLHVYGRELKEVRRYTQVEDGLYRSERTRLSTV